MEFRLTLRLAAVALFAVVVAACARPLPTYDYKKEPDPRTGEYTLGPSDELSINVWGQDNLRVTVTVRPDGTVTMPLLGDLKAAGRTARSLHDEIKLKLKPFVKDPRVAVAVTRVQSYSFTVTGKVTRVGLFQSSRYITVLEAIAMAGGPTRFSDPRRTVVVRKDGAGKPRRIPFDYQSVSAGQKLEQNVVVLPGDTIFVP